MGIAGGNLYFTPEITDDFPGFIIKDENFIIGIIRSWKVGIDAFIIAAFAGKLIDDLLVGRSVSDIAGVIISPFIGADMVDKFVG